MRKIARVVGGFFFVASLAGASSAEAQEAKRIIGFPLDEYDAKVNVLCDEQKRYGNTFSKFRTNSRAAIPLPLMEFSNLASNGVGPLTVGDFLTLLFNFAVTDTAGVNTGLKSKKIKTTFVYESTLPNGRVKRIKLGTQKLQFKNGQLTGFLQIPVETVAKFDDVASSTARRGAGTTKQGVIVAEVKRLPEIPDTDLLFTQIGLFWGAAGAGDESATDNVPDRRPH